MGASSSSSGSPDPSLDLAEGFSVELGADTGARVLGFGFQLLYLSILCDLGRVP